MRLWHQVTGNEHSSNPLDVRTTSSPFVDAGPRGSLTRRFEFRRHLRNFCYTLVVCAIGPLLYGAEGEQEALFVRRIADFWQEGEYQIAKTQMEEFMQQYPESSFSDPICAALGDLFLREKNYSNALKYYAQIQSPDCFKKVFLNRMQCLYEMQWYATLADECEAYLQTDHHLYVTYFLAIALYHQCIHASQETDQILKIAQRAKPYFQTLLESDLSEEIAQGYAHLCCILNDYGKAAEIYFDLAQKHPQNQADLLFQAALIQSKCDPERALETFERIAQIGGNKGKEAAYNRMVLEFELGRYEQVAQTDPVSQIPEERQGSARLFLGRSLLALKKYEEAIPELKAYLSEAPVSEALYAALFSLLEASYQSNDLASLDLAIEKLILHDPENRELPKAYFSRAQLLKKQGHFAQAKTELQTLLNKFPSFEQKAQACFELVHLNYKLQAWEEGYQSAARFLDQFPEHELAAFAWRYFVGCSFEIAARKEEHQVQFLQDAETFLKCPLPDSEKNEWRLVLAKHYFEASDFNQALKYLEHQDSANARLLLSFCYRDGLGDFERFCQIAEEALAKGADLVDRGQLHISLYNAYLQLSQVEVGARHLYQALMEKASLKTENLLWLADYYFNECLEHEGNPIYASRAVSLLEKCKATIETDSCKAALHLESVVSKLAKLYGAIGKFDEAIALIEPISSPSDETKLILAESYEKKGMNDRAIALFDSIISSIGTGQSPIAAAALLHKAKLHLAGLNPNLAEIGIQLKTLVLQKNWAAEPIYLEAALEYAELAAKNDPAKKLALLQKTKEDFQQTEDLLSKDYHAARAQSPQKNQMFQNYMKLMEAEILAAKAEITPSDEKELKRKAKELLLEIMNEEICSTLETRVRRILAHES